jgi:PIN domain nuclease of toxin-antitoxin system
MADEAGAEQVESVLHGALLPTVCLSEVLRRTQAYGHPSAPQRIADDLSGAGVEFDSEITKADSIRASELRHRSYVTRSGWTEDDLKLARVSKPGTLSTVDALCVAVAERHGLPVLTTDRAWAVFDRLSGGFAVKSICIR